MSADYEFPACIHVLSAAMHMQQIDPHKVTITLPRQEWWRLYCMIERRYFGFMTYDGRDGMAPESFRYMGFLFKADVVA